MTTATPAASINPIKTGQIVYNSWGYDQTNIDYYEVVKTTACFVFLRKLKSVKTETGFMCGPCTPVLGEYATPYGDEPAVTKHKVYKGFDNDPRIKFEYGCGSVWDGKPQQCSWYA